MRILFASPADLARPRGGRAMLARLHCDGLAALFGDAMAECVLVPAGGALARLSGYVDGADPPGIARVIAAIDAHAADTVWLDGSNLGRIARGVKRARPATRVVTFCHNVEARFFLGALRRRPGPRAAGVVIGNYLAERTAVGHSDQVVTLSARDSDDLAKLYGRPADAILPMALDDVPGPGAGATAPLAADAPLLFVGGAFYANQAGIAWYARHVAPRLAGIDTRVVGHGMESMRVSLERAPGMRVLGSIDDLAPCYRAARVAIAPILDGSGMKTKVAEALMHGKHVVGTPEAFSGYADDVVAANWRCADAASMAAAIRDLPDRLPGYDPAMRALYERDHSPAAARARIAGILGVVSDPGRR